MRRSNHENIDVLMLIGLVTEEEEGEGEEGKSHSKVGTRWVRQQILTPRGGFNFTHLNRVQKCAFKQHSK